MIYRDEEKMERWGGGGRIHKTNNDLAQVDTSGSLVRTALSTLSNLLAELSLRTKWL